MTQQSEQENLPIPTVAEVRAYLLNDLEASKQVLKELSDEELQTVAGGMSALNMGAITIIGTMMTSVSVTVGVSVSLSTRRHQGSDGSGGGTGGSRGGSGGIGGIGSGGGGDDSAGG